MSSAMAVGRHLVSAVPLEVLVRDAVDDIQLRLAADEQDDRYVGFPYLRAWPRRSVRGAAPDPGSHRSHKPRLSEGPGVFLCLTACTRRPFSGGSPMTDVAYLCHNCGTVHEVETIR